MEKERENNVSRKDNRKFEIILRRLKMSGGSFDYMYGRIEETYC
jgi:hypothetical protein